MNLRTSLAVACLPAGGRMVRLDRRQKRLKGSGARLGPPCKWRRRCECTATCRSPVGPRGALQERALSVRPGIENLADVGARNDALLDRTQRSMNAAGLADEVVIRARALLREARGRFSETTKRPQAQSDPSLMPPMMMQINERLDDVERAVARAEREPAPANASVGALLAIGNLAVDMRSAAGTNLSGWFGGMAVTPEQLDQSMYTTGQLQYARERLQRQVLIVGDPPQLAAAATATGDTFFSRAKPRYRQILAIVQAEGERPMLLAERRRWTVEAQEHLAIAAAATPGPGPWANGRPSAASELNLEVAGEGCRGACADLVRFPSASSASVGKRG